MMKKRLEKRCESGLLLLVILIIGYAHLATGGVRQVDRIVLSSLAVLILFVWILRLWVLTKSRILIPPVTWGVLLFTGYALWQYGRADVEYLARKEVVFCLIAAILFIVTVSSLHRQEASQWICVALVFLAMVTSIYAIYQYVTPSSSVWNIPQWIQYRDRASGTYINPNHFSGFLELVFPLCLSLVILGRFGHAPKILMGYAAVVMIGGIAVTFSRGGWVSFGLTVVLFSVFLLTQKDYRNRGILMIVLGSLALIGVFRKSDFDQSRFQTAFGDGHIQNVRFPIWEGAVNVFRNNNPWTGVGPGHFSAHWFRYRPEQVQTSAEHVHNDYLELLVNWGLIGVILVSLILILFFVGMARTWKFVKPEIKNFTVKHSTKAALVVGVCFSMIAILVHSFVDFNMHIPANALLVSLLLAISSGYCRFSTDAYWFRLNGLVKGILTLVAISTAVFLISVIVREWPSEREITRSGRGSGFSEKLGHLQKAFEADPLNFKTSQGIALRLIL
ncbi:MAG TPA: hypothetical protein EYG38_19220, partial [Verrucomicrobia bacterium]|nr:hypothetical protein [Verrucomicrobiota bacterium]